MFELFEFTRLFTVQSSRPHSHGKVDICRFAWREEGEISFLALLCSNDQLLLRYGINGRTPIIKQLPWLPDKSIASLCFDPTLSWLLIVTESSQEAFIIPALSIVEPDALINQLFKTDDVTLRTFQCINGIVCSALWWQTLDGRQIAIIATDIGEIVFVDLMSEEERVTKITIDITVTDLSLSHDDLQMNSTLLITTVTGNQWRLLLETKTNVPNFSMDSDVAEMGYDNIDGRTIPPRTILDMAEENSAIFAPTQFQNFEPPTLLKPQFAKGRHFITAHCTLSSTLEVMDSDAEHSPLFVYKLPVGAENVILTDRLIFTMIHDSRDKKLMVLSNQKSENLMNDQQGYNTEAIVQEFSLPDEETLIGVERKRYPFYYHEHHENEWTNRIRAGSIILPVRNQDSELDSSVLGIPVTTHTVLDGCVIVTNCCVYEIRPCISPERLFLHLALTSTETTQAENLAISIGLDLTSLSELAADFLLRRGSFSRAMKLYTLSKCPATKRTGGLARYGCVSETMIHLRQVLSSPSFELNTSERKFLSNMLLHCFVYQLHSGGQAVANVQAGLSDFLFGSFSFDEQTALNLLADFGEVDLILTFAKARGLVVDALMALVQAEAFTEISFSSLNDLVQRGFSAHLIQCGKGSYLPCLSPEDLVRLLITRPQLAIHNSGVLRPLISVLQPQQLLELARIFDPSKSVMRGTLQRLHTSRRRTNSLTSLCSVASEGLESSSENRDMRADSLLEFFLTTVLYLNHQRRQSTPTLQKSLEFESIVNSPVSEVDNVDQDGSAGEGRRRLSVQAQLLCGGAKHSAVVRNGDLYTWGRSLQGRLGHGDIPHAVCPPVRVETLHILKLKVDAVACGTEHTLALTQQGVYGWGSSKYGQVGVGTCHVYRRPMLLETMQSEVVVAVDCGLYHSLALTADHQVYTWGWGVHGQLGHGNPEDCLVPTHVRDLLNVGVVKVAGGYAHSLALTESGDVFAFGCGYFGQLGQGTNTKSSRPLKIHEIPQPVMSIATKYFHSVAVTTTNKVYVWGCHPHNLRQVASSMRQGKAAGRYIPEQTSFLNPSLVDTTYVHGKITKVCCGSLHTVLVAEDGGVYVWGRNLEGQLGTGSRQDERMPKMLTSINDQNIVCVASGGEFTLAMDAEGSVWLWGKNDSGQLGFARSRRDGQGSSKVGGALGFHRSSSQPHNMEASTPSELKGLPVSDVNDPLWMSLLGSLSVDNIWSDNQTLESENVLETLPHLDQLGAEMYDSCVIPVVLKALESVCHSSPSLQKSVDLGDWLTAGQISCLEEHYVQALHYRLKAVMEGACGVVSEVGTNLCAQLVAHHIRLVSDKALPASHIRKELQQLCSHTLYLWQEYGLPITNLESIFSQHLSTLASWLVQVVLRLPSGLSSLPLSQQQEPFSAPFALRVLKSAMDSSNSAENKFAPDWRQMLAGRVPDHTVLLKGVHLQSKDKLTPQDRLWGDILKNMKKDSGVITLTHSQLDYLDEQEQRSKDPRPSSKSIVFSCGHSFSESVFKSEAMPSLTSELTSGGLRLPNSSSLLQHLLQRPGLKPAACPKCILHGLRMS
ncbi:uncharacterized protein LOC101858037 isoform X2 [Aplysia californica]|uniref:Uncharacterized protein LOC101858037 isoform X2 n=1 Tax=Aplysia californica TaxID=6500 RepID=A0ABM0JS49_APLCA|nr:uncharacterized protein LOC101858037 isoform X2 [Aplysia californica]